MPLGRSIDCKPAVRGRKSWREKLADDKGLPREFTITRQQSRRWGEGTCTIPAPREVDAFMRRVPRGRVTTINELRSAIAKAHGTTIACPITTGIFSWIAAHAAAEAEAEGKRRITPYWRTLKLKGELNPKYPGGAAGLKSRLHAEGHRVIRKGTRYFVANFESRLAGLQSARLRQFVTPDNSVVRRGERLAKIASAVQPAWAPSQA